MTSKYCDSLLQLLKRLKIERVWLFDFWFFSNFFGWKLRVWWIWGLIPNFKISLQCIWMISADSEKNWIKLFFSFKKFFFIKSLLTRRTHYPSAWSKLVPCPLMVSFLLCYMIAWFYPKFKKTLTWAFKNGLIIQMEKIDFFPIAAGLLALPHTAKVHAWTASVVEL